MVSLTIEIAVRIKGFQIGSPLISLIYLAAILSRLNRGAAAVTYKHFDS